MHEQSSKEDHQAISEVIPWFVNGTLGELERQRVDAHLRTCAVCREELLHEQRVYRAMAGEAGIEYIPAASLRRLQARLDALGAQAAPHETAAVAASAVGERGRRWLPWQRRVAASIALVAVILGLTSLGQWGRFRAREFSPAYHTVTTSESRPPGEVIRAVFAPSITLVELQTILDEAQLRIVAGPSEAGVYSLAANSPRPAGSSLALLRRHAAVRFAESTEPSLKPAGPNEPP